jgi:hypothetical protein
MGKDRTSGTMEMMNIIRVNGGMGVEKDKVREYMGRIMMLIPILLMNEVGTIVIVQEKENRLERMKISMMENGLMIMIHLMEKVLSASRTQREQ